MTSTRLRQMSVLCLCVGLIACTGTPVTEPPSVAPPAFPQLNARETLPEFQGLASDAATPLGVSGRAGSVAPDALVWAINLDSDNPAVVARADADGSFEVPVAADIGDELRMHALVDLVPSVPVDMIVGSGLSLETPAHRSCARTTPTMLDFGTLDVGDATSLELLVENTCAEAMEISTPRLHSSAPDFQMALEAMNTLSKGESTMVSLTFEPLASADNLRSTVLLIDIAIGATTDRVAVTLWGRVH